MKVCRSDLRCSKCKGKHHVAICRSNETKEVNHNAMADAKADAKTEVKTDAKKDEKPKEDPETISSLLSGSHQAAKKTIILQSASIWTKSPTKRIKIRALFDTGSQRTFITKRLASKLQCEVICKERLSISSFGNDKSVDSEFDLVSVILESAREDLDVEALVASTISIPILMKVEQEWLDQPQLKG